MGMNLKQVLLIVRLRWWIIVLAFLLVLAAAATFVAVVPKRYVSTVSVIVDTKTDPLLAALAPNVGGTYLATQVEIIRSDRVAAKVVKMLGLADDPAAVARWREKTNGRVSVESFFGEMLQGGLSVEGGRGSSILNVSFSAADPKFAAAAANAFARAYIDLGVELKVGPAREYASFFDERQKALRADLEAAQGRLSEFQKKKGILITNERLDQETSRLASLEAALDAAIAQSAETSSRVRNTGTESSFDVQQSGVVQGLKAELARAETKLNEISTTYGPNHPTRIQLDAQIAELKEQLAREMRRVSAATSNVNRITSQKISELRALVDAQKKTVLSMRAERDEASVILKDLETAQRAYEQVAQRRAQLSTESQAEQATARILSPAVEPLKPAFPDVLKVMGIAVLAGLALGVGVAVGWEIVDRRIRSASDMESAQGVPVLGVLGSRPARTKLMPYLPRAAAPGGPPRLTLDGGTT